MSNAETKPYETKVVSEQQAAAFREMLLQLKRELGDDGYHNFAIELAEQYERMLRRKLSRTSNPGGARPTPGKRIVSSRLTVSRCTELRRVSEARESSA